MAGKVEEDSPLCPLWFGQLGLSCVTRHQVGAQVTSHRWDPVGRGCSLVLCFLVGRWHLRSPMLEPPALRSGRPHDAFVASCLPWVALPWCGRGW